MIRPYRDEDRRAVRDICFETGYLGAPVVHLWRDQESFADMFSGYYTDREPESAFVAEVDGRVVGYLLGCRDSRRVPSELRVLGHHVVRRGIALRPGTAGFLWRAAADVAGDAVRHQLASPPRFDERWPAHLHIDLLPHGRGRGLGAALVRTWLDLLRSEGVAGCHLGTFAENLPAIAFFESEGFERYGRQELVPGMRSPEGGRHHTQLMVQSLSSRG